VGERREVVVATRRTSQIYILLCDCVTITTAIVDGGFKATSCVYHQRSNPNTLHNIWVAFRIRSSRLTW